jgi:putative N6-adenine-specific DNA methylase
MQLDLAVITAPGLEQVTRGELDLLGLMAGEGEPGLIPFTGSLDDVARANLHLRTASRVILRLGSFHARALGELERKAGELPWDDWLAPDAPIALRVTSRKSRLYHQRAVAERVAKGAGRPFQPSGLEEAGPGVQLVVVRLLRDECIVSLDSSGALLHRRGYRLEGGKAPLRETLAAALLLASGWDPATPLIDPFCGSGTIPVEAALKARGIPPGLEREFAFERWLKRGERGWEALRAEARAAIVPRAPAPILGSDRDAGAIDAARRNAERAGVADDIEFRQLALSSVDPPARVGALVSNPPYGRRIGETRELRDLYARLGQVARERLPGWQIALLVPAAPIERGMGVTWEEALRTRNGGQPVRLVRGRIQTT